MRVRMMSFGTCVCLCSRSQAVSVDVRIQCQGLWEIYLEHPRISTSGICFVVSSFVSFRP